ncbi:hypothetical protein CHISP_2263 [Chitinispirillum alkaliphilum]|nr:hypothetical protein CHISP_2263 [Chitinispirillum alkaliphilum]
MIVPKPDFSFKKSSLLIIAAVGITLLISALVSIKKRPIHLIRGKKVYWVLISFIDIIGPITYFLFGRIKNDKRKDFL